LADQQGSLLMLCQCWHWTITGTNGGRREIVAEIIEYIIQKPNIIVDIQTIKKANKKVSVQEVPSRLGFEIFVEINY
jgi:hypothetical protein